MVPEDVETTVPDNNPNDDARLDGGAADGVDERAKPVFDMDGHESVDTEVSDEGETKVELYNANHGKAPRTGGPYLDDVQAQEAEKWRAIKEDREPDYENPPAVAGTYLVPKSQLVERDTDKSHYSDRVEVENEPVDSYVVPAEENKADPTQPNWDNDSTKVAALEASQKFEELKAKAEENQSEPAADPNPSDSEDSPEFTDSSASGTPLTEKDEPVSERKETWEV